MKFMIVSIFVLFSIIGCSSQAVTEYSVTQNWVGLAQYDVEAGRKARSADDLTKLGATEPTQKDAYWSAYTAHVKEYCNPDNAYNAGLLGKPRNNVCIDSTPQGWIYEKNWETGREGNSF
ncbi:DUF2799 domain-containing protein [Photobacterium nomapromontoriensis]|uniref:DUF2799 domain-containing protein n=1 Tax=Photobacterium nomapromontoriensis TaxID=2910237 RepID=UPI003D101E9D